MVRQRPISLTMLALVWLALLVWALVSDPADPARFGTAAALILSAAGFMLIASTGSRGRWSAGFLAVVGVTAVFLTPQGNAWVGGPSMPPLRYGNATAMLVVVAVAGVVLAGSVARPPWPRPLAPSLTGVGLLATCLMQAKAALLTCALLLAWYAARRWGRPLGWVVLAAASTAASWVAVAWWGLHPVRVPTVVVSTLTETRIDLWHDAVLIARAHLVAGAGPGQFPVLSPTAQDPDVAWAHSAPLQLAAELGLVGLALFGLLVLLLLTGSGRWSPVLAIVLLPTTIDYVLDFPSIIVLVAAVAGATWALAGREPGANAPSAAPSPGDGNPVLTPPAP